MMKATKNNGTFEAINTNEGMRYTAERENVAILITPCDFYFNAVLSVSEQPMATAEGYDAEWAVAQLAKASRTVEWAEEGMGDKVMALAKDLHEFIGRPMQESFNSRSIRH